MLNKVNAGFTIIAERNSFMGGLIVLGMRRQPDGYDYVTWYFDGDVDEVGAYFWGHYFDRHNGLIFSDAVKDFETR